MPRDLLQEKQDIDALPPLEREPAQRDFAAQANNDTTDKIQRDMIKKTGLGELNPIRQLLTPEDVQSCAIIERAVFGDCSRAKIEYRIKKCPELCMGLFVSATPGSEHAKGPTWEHSKVVSDGSRRLMLVAVAIGSKTTNGTIQKEDVEVPANTDHSTVPEVADRRPDSPRRGHKEEGRTLALHTLAVLPQHQGKDLGSILLRSYIQSIREQQVADRVAAIAQPDVVKFYEKHGFKKVGKSNVKFGDREFFDMVYEFPPS